MLDPYKVLGVSKFDSDEKAKSAYRELAKKYHPDNYDSSPMSEMAAEKMKEIDDAYDQIMDERRKNRNNDFSYSYVNGDRKSNYNDVRNFIMSGRIDAAEQVLNGVPSDRRNAEWYFLKGTVSYKKGWLEEAYENFSRASQMDPGNQEYRSALNRLEKQRNGFYGGYNPMMDNRGCSGCDVCTSLLCADCCCECIGGDCIRCC